MNLKMRKPKPGELSYLSAWDASLVPMKETIMFETFIKYAHGKCPEERIVVDQNDQPIAFVAWQIKDDRSLYIDWLYVLKSHRRVGIGTWIIQQLRLLSPVNIIAIPATTTAAWFFINNSFQGESNTPGQPLKLNL